MADQASFDPANVRIYNLPATPRAQLLNALQRYGTGEQWDHLDIDWTGRRRDAWTPHAIERLRAVGVWTVAAAANGNVAKRPNAPVPLAGLVVEGFTDILLGEGREPAVKVAGDQDTEATLEAVFSTSETWDALAEARDQLGRCGCAGFLPVLEDGRPSAQVLNASDIVVLEWEPRGAWTPKVVVEQKMVLVPVEVDGIRQEKPAWRTRAWDQTHAYVYEDVLLDNTATKREDETEEAYQRRKLRTDEQLVLKPGTPAAPNPIEHHAGRCPVVWLQNTRDSKSPDSAADYDQQSLELMDRADVLQSMLVRGSIANVDPTLHIADYVWAQRFWPTREKGYGKVIQTSESGSAKLIEIAGTSVDSSRTTLREIILQVEHRCGIVIIDPDTAGSYRSGEAISLLWRRMEQAAGRKRRSLTRAVRQIAEIWIAILGSVGIANVELPPKITPNPDGKGEATIADQTLGKGRWIKVEWPPYNYPTAAQLVATTQALSVATGNKQILSSETATGWLLNTMGRTDAAREREMIDAEQQARVDALDDELAAGLTGEPDLDDDPERDGDSAKTDPAIAGVGESGTVQDTALNGAQVKVLMEIVASAGTLIAPPAAVLMIINAFQWIDRKAAQEMVDAQVSFAKENGLGQPDAKAKPGASPEQVEQRAQEFALDTGDEQEDDDGHETEEFTEE